VAPIEINTELIFNQPPMSKRFLIPESQQRTSCVLSTDQLDTTVPLIMDKQETTPIFHAGI